MSDGTSLNAKLAAMMPMEPGAEQRIEDTDAHFEGDTEYKVTATPASGWYGIVIGPAGRAIGDTAGAPVSFSLTPTVSGSNTQLGGTAGASSTGTQEGQASMILLDIRRRTDD